MQRTLRFKLNPTPEQKTVLLDTLAQHAECFNPVAAYGWENAEKNGVEVIVAAAGWAAHLPGVIAAYTILPVIGVPLNTSPLNGIDSVMSILQMPKGVPVAAVAIGEAGVTNATILAAEILALKYPPVKKKLINWKKRLQSSANTSSKNKQ